MNAPFVQLSEAWMVELEELRDERADTVLKPLAGVRQSVVAPDPNSDQLSKAQRVGVRRDPMLLRISVALLESIGPQRGAKVLGERRRFHFRSYRKIDANTGR